MSPKQQPQPAALRSPSIRVAHDRGTQTDLPAAAAPAVVAADTVPQSPVAAPRSPSSQGMQLDGAATFTGRAALALGRQAMAMAAAVQRKLTAVAAAQRAMGPLPPARPVPAR
jgi:hypothetical protein